MCLFLRQLSCEICHQNDTYVMSSVHDLKCLDFWLFLKKFVTNFESVVVVQIQRTQTDTHARVNFRLPFWNTLNLMHAYLNIVEMLFFPIDLAMIISETVKIEEEDVCDWRRKKTNHQILCVENANEMSYMNARVSVWNIGISFHLNQYSRSISLEPKSFFFFCAYLMLIITIITQWQCKHENAFYKQNLVSAYKFSDTDYYNSRDTDKQ